MSAFVALPSRAYLARTRPGYTLVELLTATLLSLLMMAGVATIFGTVGTSIANSRAALEMTQRLKAAADTLAEDLNGVTVTMLPPRPPGAAEGYFEYLEGPLGIAEFDPDNPRQINDTLLTTNNADAYFPVVPLTPDGELDTTVGDIDDILMFTARNSAHPFIGRYSSTATTQSEIAEIAWFVRGRTLYRRVLLVLPNATLSAPQGFFQNNDISVRNASGSLVANTLSDLTKRENRFAHRGSSPFDIRQWGQLRLPTLEECSYYDSATPANSWLAGATGPFTVPTPYSRTNPVDAVDFWANPHPWGSLISDASSNWTDLDGSGSTDVDTTAGRLSAYGGTRYAEDVVLTNVIGFDVKAWDPGAPVFSDTSTGDKLILLPGDPRYWTELNATSSATPANLVSRGAYVDLNYSKGLTAASKAVLSQSYFAGVGQASQLNAGLGWTYDTWSTHEIALGANGFDDDTNGVVDDATEMETTPPYPRPLRAVQVKLRVFDPDSRQIREVTIVQDFSRK